MLVRSSVGSHQGNQSRPRRTYGYGGDPGQLWPLIIDPSPQSEIDMENVGDNDNWHQQLLERF